MTYIKIVSTPPSSNKLSFQDKWLLTIFYENWKKNKWNWNVFYVDYIYYFKIKIICIVLKCFVNTIRNLLNDVNLGRRGS